jgi:hypothetical protein
MSEKRSKSTVLIVGLLLVTGLHIAAGQALAGKRSNQPQQDPSTDSTSKYRTGGTLVESKDDEVVAAVPDQPQLRTWTDPSGTFRVEAAFVESKGGKVTLKKKDGTVLSVPLEKLSDSDQQYVKLSSQKMAGADGLGAPAGIAPKKTPTKKGPAWNIFTNKKTGKMFTGKILDRKEKQDTWFFLVEDENGQRDWLRASWFVISKAPENDRPQATDTPSSVDPGSPGSTPGRSVVDINPSVAERPPHAALPEAKEVVVTGVGTDSDKAVTNAFSEAIQQAVGLLVDAETVVKNDQLIRDEVLTYSRGYVEEYNVVKQWQEDGLHHATIRAVVARDKLAEKLRGMKIALADVAGDRVSHQFEFDAKNEEQAAEMFKKALAEFDMTKLAKVEIVGKPEPAREGVNAKIHIKAKVSPDMKQWQIFSRQLQPLLEKTATKRAGATTVNKMVHFLGGYDRDNPLARQLSGSGTLVALFANTNLRGDETQWKFFRVPKTIRGPIEEAAENLAYRVAFVLLANDETEVARTSEVIHEEIVHRPAKPIRRESVYGAGDVWWIGPVWWWSNSNYPSAHYSISTTLVLSQEDLGKVAKTAVFLENISEHGNTKHAKHSGKTR